MKRRQQKEALVARGSELDFLQETDQNLPCNGGPFHPCVTMIVVMMTMIVVTLVAMFKDDDGGCEDDSDGGCEDDSDGDDDLSVIATLV